jgi:hypothetical protein
MAGCSCSATGAGSPDAPHATFGPWHGQTEYELLPAWLYTHLFSSLSGSHQLLLLLQGHTLLHHGGADMTAGWPRLVPPTNPGVPPGSLAAQAIQTSTAAGC